MKKISGLSLFLYLFLTIILSSTQAAEKPTLEGIDFKAIGTDKEQVTFKLNGTYIPKIFAIKGKNPRVVFDFPKTGISRTMPNSIKTNGAYIRQIRIGLHTGKNPKTRVVFDLTGKQKINFNQHFTKKNNTLTILIFPSKNAAEKTLADKAKKSSPLATGQPSLKKETALVAPRPTPGPTTVPSAVSEQTASATTLPVSSKTAVNQNNKKSVNNKPVKPTQAAALPKVSAGTGEKASHIVEKSKTKNINPSIKSNLGIPVLQSVSFDNTSNRGEMIQFSVTEFHPPTVFGIEEGPPRVVCDFKNTRAGAALKNIIKADGRYVKTIRIGRHKNPDKIRVVIDLVANNNYDLQQVFFKEENLFVIIVNTMHNGALSEKKTDKISPPVH